MKTVYLIGGPMDVGKTTVAQALKLQLERSVFLDGDWCWDAHPFEVTEETKTMVLGNIRFLLGQFVRCTAYDHVIFCWVMHEQSIIDSIVNALDTGLCRVVSVSLTAGPKTLEDRLRRDMVNGIRSADVIARSLDRLSLYDGLDTVKIPTDNLTIAQIVERIIAVSASTSS